MPYCKTLFWTFFDKADIWRNMTAHIILWRHISSDISFIKKCSVSKFFSTKFPIEWAVRLLSTIILNICEKWYLYGKFKIFFFFTRFLIIHGITDWYQILGIFLSILFMKNFSKLLIFLKKKNFTKGGYDRIGWFFFRPVFFFYQKRNLYGMEKWN